MKTTTCIEPVTLRRLLEQALSASETNLCESHLETCPHCRLKLEQLAGEPQWWQETVSMLAAEGFDTAASSGRASSPDKSDPRFGQRSDSQQSSHAFQSVEPGSVPQRALGDWSPAVDLDTKTIMLRQVRQLLESPSHPEMLGRLGGYEIESLLGQGGFGVVFRAFDRELNRPVAIKVLAPHLATVGTARRRFVREAQAAAAVAHPNVVPIHAVCTDAPYPFLVMSFIPGRSLQEQVRQDGPMEPKAIARIGQQVAAGLAAAHRQGLVHRDIKPANILLENGLDRALITDFGLARAADDAISQTGWLAGTPHYMSPEQAASGELDGRSDLFSLGCVLYFIATGREPFRGTQPLAIMNQIAHHKPQPVRSMNSDIPQVLAQVIERLLEKKPADRFQSAEELSDFLEQYVAYLHQPETRIKPRVPSKRGAKRFSSMMLLGSAMTLLLAAVLYGALVWSTGMAANRLARDSHGGPKESQTAPNKSMANESRPNEKFPDQVAATEAKPEQPAPLPIPTAYLQQALATWDEDEAELQHDFVRMSQSLDFIEQHWRRLDARPLSVDEFGSASSAPLDLSTLLQEIEMAIRELETTASSEMLEILNHQQPSTIGE
jgi:serine/threonine protein kinase